MSRKSHVRNKLRKIIYRPTWVGGLTVAMQISEIKCILTHEK